jgi:teichuronic acid biosynthesis glycosyltransferase TuaC
MLRVLTFSTLFPDSTRPHFSPFVEAQTLALAAREEIALQVVAPIGIPPVLGAFHPRYAKLAALPRVENWKGLTVHRPHFAHLPGPGARFDGWALARAVTPVLAAIRRDFPFDVIDAQFFWPDGAAAVALGKRFGVPVSIKSRGSDILFWGQHRSIAAQITAAGQKADGMLAVSEALKSDMIALGMPGERITVHYTGLDRDRFLVRDRAAAKRALGVEGPLLVSVANLVERKGHQIAIDAMRQIPDARLVIIGRGEHEPALVRQIAEMQLGDRVTLLGAKPHTVIADWLAAADIMVLISESEGLANSWVEALASGTPVVISNAGGAAEVVNTPETGRIVAREPSAVATAVQDVLNAAIPRDLVAKNAARFSWHQNAAELSAHLHALVVPRHS